MNEKKILITGASGSIGSELIKILQSLDYEIVATYNTTEPTKDLVGIQNCQWLQVDLGDSVFPMQFIDSLTGVNCFIHLAAVTEVAKINQINLQKLNRTFRINVISAIEIVSRILPNMVEKKFGRVIFCGSIVGEYGGVGLASYSSTKSSLEGLTKSINKEFQLLKNKEADLNLCVATLRGGYTETPLTDGLKSSIKEEIIKSSVMNRFLYPSEIAREIGRLLKDSAYIYSGSILDVNGGQTI